MRVIALSATTAAMIICGCADIPYDTADLVPPARRCMVAPQSLTRLKAGDDLVQSYASAVRSYGRETSKLRCVQRWARTVINK
jgi:hypothetical protein